MSNKKRWTDHAAFLGELADRVTWLAIAQGADRTEAVNEYTRWLAESCFKHAEKHLLEDFENGLNGLNESGKAVDGPLVGNSIVEVFGKVVGVTQKADVSENQMSGEISVSGDRVKRVESSFDTGRKGWDVAKREPHVYADDDDDSVIISQNECAKRFAEGEAVRRNYAGIND